jgi:hypothetical protein
MKAKRLGSKPRSMLTQPNGPGHAGIGDRQDRLGGLGGRETQLRADMGVDGARGGLHIEPGELAADGIVGVDAAEHHVCVGHGRAVLPPP